LGAAFVAFSPVARGFLCGATLDIAGFDAKDIRRNMPRFTPENYAANLKLLPSYHALAKEAGCSPSQLALAWLLHKGEDIIPIPGTTSVNHLLDDLASVDVTFPPLGATPPSRSASQRQTEAKASVIKHQASGCAIGAACLKASSSPHA
jgi:aryl-alcohol dehydrogenase-like predicted oxidoreductase